MAALPLRGRRVGAAWGVWALVAAACLIAAQTGGGGRVELEDIGEYEGEAAWKITTPPATYYYHHRSGGFASLVDRDGNDWISYHPGGKERGEYRGIPNIAPPQFHPGRPEGKRPGRIVSRSESHVSLLAETEDGRWATQWDIHADHARMTLLRKGEEPYWILYEGTPGGRFETTDYWVNSRGERFESAPYVQKNMWHGDLPEPEWVYFGDAKMKRVLVLKREPYSPAMDEYWHFGDGGMTVFGFGRGPRESGWQRLADVPCELTIAFVESDRHADVARAVKSFGRRAQRPRD
jgi:hypothetical protein